MQKEHFEILLESVDSKMQLVLEGYSVLANQIKDTKTELIERVDLVDFKLDVLNKKIDGVAADLKATDEKLTRKIDAVAADLKATDEKLTRKIDAVDEKLTKKIDAVAADLKAHRSDTEAHNSGLYVVKECNN